MRKTILEAGLCLALVALFTASPLPAQEGGEGEAGDMAAMMQAFQASLTPGEPHEELATTTGKFDLTVKTWMDPSQPPSESKATAEREMILGGRVLEERVDGSFMGMPFTGIGQTGYDNVTGRYWSTWMDSMSTAVFTQWGDYDDDGHLVMIGEGADPMSGGMKEMKTVVAEIDGKETIRFYEERGGQEVQTMEIVYTRRGE